jgi:hypothetical protein
METRVVVQFSNNEELIHFLEYLKEKGIDNLVLKVKKKPIKTIGGREARTTAIKAKDWTGLGSVDLKGRLNSISNLRDFAYDE